MEQRIARTILICSALAVAPGRAKAQKPVINPGGIVNAATFAPKGQPGSGVCCGALASVFGQNLASTTAWATGFPLPNTLAGTTVTFGGIPAPLIYVSPTQINLQVPAKAPYPHAPVVVTTSAGTSEPEPAPSGSPPGIFTLDGSGCGRGAVFNVAQDGTVSLNGPENSAEPGGILTVYGTGLAFEAEPNLPDGMPAPASPPVRYSGDAKVMPILRDATIGSRYTLFAGAAPGYAGVDQFNIRLPDDFPEGCSVALQLFADPWQRTQAIPISVRRGGGQCVDAPDSLAVFLWTRTVATGINPPPPADTLFIEFSSGIGKKAPEFPPLKPGVFLVTRSSPDSAPYQGYAFPLGANCPAFSGDRQLDAGILTAEAPGLSLRIPPQTVNGQPRYSATLPAGTIHSGTYRITGAGGADVGPFATSLNFPEPIRLTTQFPPGTVLDLSGYGTWLLPIRWEGGNPDSTVTVMISNSAQFYQGTGSAASGQAGAATVSGPVEIVVTQTTMQRFQAAGLTLGGWHVWSYEFRFGGVTINHHWVPRE